MQHRAWQVIGLGAVPLHLWECQWLCCSLPEWCFRNTIVGAYIGHAWIPQDEVLKGFLRLQGLRDKWRPTRCQIFHAACWDQSLVTSSPAVLDRASAVLGRLRRNKQCEWPVILCLSLSSGPVLFFCRDVAAAGFCCCFLSHLHSLFSSRRRKQGA